MTLETIQQIDLVHDLLHVEFGGDAQSCSTLGWVMEVRGYQPLCANIPQHHPTAILEV